MLLPIFYLFIRASGSGTGVWKLIAVPRTAALLLNTVTLAAAVTAASIILSVPLAWLTVRSDLPFKRWWSVALAVPLAIPSYLGAYTLVAALGQRGMLQQILGPVLGIDRFPSIYGFPGAALALTLFSYPYVYLNVRAALMRLDPSLEEASRSLGFDGWATFRRVVLPSLRPAITSGALLVALYVFSDFGAVSFMQYDTFTRAIYLQYLGAFDRSYGAALSLVLVACTALVLVLESWTRRKAAYARVGGGPQKPPPPVPLGRWRWPALALCGAVTVMAIILPAAVVTYWLWRGLAAGQALTPVWNAALQSVAMGAAGAVATVLVAWPVAVVISRTAGKAARWVEGIIYLGYALPGIVVALSLVFFGINVVPRFYQGFGLLIFAYVVMFLPQAVGALRSALLQISPNIEAAARTLGATPSAVFRTVTFPMVRPGITAGAALVFLTVMKELPATLLLSPPGFRTLASVVWSTTNEGFYTRAAPAALLLMLVSFVSVMFLFRDGGWRRGRRSVPGAGPTAAGGGESAGRGSLVS